MNTLFSKPWLLGACALGFALGLAWLLAQRFAGGDVYPPYSSLRADPLGTMAFYESLERLPQLTVSRDFTITNEMPADHHTTYLHLAASPSETSLPPEAFRAVEAFLLHGGRLVVTYFPEETESDSTQPSANDASAKKPATPAKSSAKPAEPTAPATTPTPGAKPDEKKAVADKPAKKPAKPKAKPDADEETEPEISLTEKWGFQTAFDALPESETHYDSVLVFRKSELALPAAMSWHSAMTLSELDPAWNVIYARGQAPVLVERAFGAGSVILATDSYFLSNEALFKEPHADLLAWILGDNPNVVFDEAHLGVTQTSNIAGLIRQFRLHGLVVGLLVLALLFIWKSAASLVPPHAVEAPSPYVAGKDAAGGFVNLLRRHVPGTKVLDLCVTEWKKSRARLVPAVKLQQIQAVLEAENTRPARQRDAVAAYNQISAILRQPVLSGAETAPTQPPAS